MTEINTLSPTRMIMKQAWRWCPICEKAFMSNSNDKCCYRGCDGSDVREWYDVRSENTCYPETHVLGHIYHPVARPEKS